MPRRTGRPWPDSWRDCRKTIRSGLGPRLRSPFPRAASPADGSPGQRPGLIAQKISSPVRATEACASGFRPLAPVGCGGSASGELDGAGDSPVAPPPHRLEVSMNGPLTMGAEDGPVRPNVPPSPGAAGEASALEKIHLGQGEGERSAANKLPLSNRHPPRYSHRVSQKTKRPETFYKNHFA